VKDASTKHTHTDTRTHTHQCVYARRHHENIHMWIPVQASDTWSDASLVCRYSDMNMDMDVNHGMYEFIHLSIYRQMVYIMCRFVLQCVAVCCSVLQCVAVSTKLRISPNLTELRISPELTKLPVNLTSCLVRTATHCSTLQHTTARCDTLRHIATHRPLSHAL